MNLSQPIKGIFFDIDGTLNYNATDYWMFPKKAESIVNLDGIYNIPIKRFNTVYTKCKDYIKTNQIAETTEEEYRFFLAFYTMIADTLPEFELTKEKIQLVAYDKVYNLENNIFYDDTYETIEYLSKKYKLGLLSNSWPSCKNSLESANMYDFFSSISLSCHLGVCKPDPRIYEHALLEMNFPAEQTVLIDDSKSNLKGAKEWGIQTVLLNTKNTKKYNDFLTIFSLSELMEVL